MPAPLLSRPLPGDGEVCLQTRLLNDLALSLARLRHDLCLVEDRASAIAKDDPASDDDGSRVRTASGVDEVVQQSRLRKQVRLIQGDDGDIAHLARFERADFPLHSHRLCGLIVASSSACSALPKRRSPNLTRCM